ncbi:hypothetical protein C0J52_04801 [Blattella germanica]|nr:hypothetical protein C0J52_04801 [Blattella germanica]
MEMHVVHFKSSYRTQESALKEKDGMITMVYFFKIDKFRTLSDASNGRMMRNYRETQVSKDSIVFHILPSKNITTTLLPVSEIQQQTNQKIHNSSHISAKSTEPKEVPLLPPGMFPREIFVQPSGMSYEEAYGYPGSSSQYLNQGHPIPFLIPIAPVSGSQYKNIYGYAPAMMYEYPADHSRAIYTDKSVGTSTAVETSESEIHRAKKNNRKLAKKTQVSSTMKGNKVSFEDSPVMPKRTEAERIVKERKIIEDQAISGKPHKIEREPRQRVQSRRESLDSSQNYESLMKSMQPICDMEKIEELGLTTQDILETRGWMFVKPYMEAALPTSCKEAKYYELGNNNQGAYS